MKRILAGIVIAAVLGLSLIPSEMRNTWLSGSWSPVKSAHKYKGRFFRMKVALTYKGEPQKFDVVYGCNVNYVRYKDGASTSEIGLVPSVYGRRMNDGKGLIIQAPQAACQDNPAPHFNPRLITNFMPLVVVYEYADELGFGTAYISEDAYDSAVSDLKFGAASVEAATREEFEEFRANGPPNLVRRETYHSENLSDENAKALGIPPIRPLDELPGFGFNCRAYARFKVSEEIRGILRTYWPNNEPKYWEPESAEHALAMQKAFKWPMMVARDDGDEFRDLRLFRVSGSELQYGVRRRGDDILIDKPERQYLPPSYYPSYSEAALHFFPRDRASFDDYINKKTSFAMPVIHMRDGAMKGKGYCFKPGAPKGEQSTRYFYGIKRTAAVDGEPVQLNTTYNDGLEGSFYFYEKDQYIWQGYQFGIGSTNGDL